MISMPWQVTFSDSPCLGVRKLASVLVLGAGLKTTGRRKRARRRQAELIQGSHAVMKPLSARWITSAYDYLRSDSGIVLGGFLEAGIVEALDHAC